MSDIGNQLVQYAQNRLGKKVGRGQCWDLPFHALQGVGAKTPHDLGEDLYVWGEEISLSEATKGDILQFEDVVIRREWNDGDKTKWEEWSFRPRHSAIIEAKSGVFYTLLNQHIRRQEKVTRLARIPLGSEFITRGSIRAYRPVKKE